MDRAGYFQLLKGISQFNERKFFECHETLEELWHKENGASRKLLQGIIQLAVAYHHLLHGNLEGASRLLRAGLAKIEPFLPKMWGIDLASLKSEAKADLDLISESLGSGSKSLLNSINPAIIRIDEGKPFDFSC